MKKTMKRHSFKLGLLSLMALCSMALTIGSCANDDVAQNPTMPNDDKNLTTFAAGTPTTRTSMESDGKFFWEQGDKIYVKDDNGAWHASSNSPTGKTDNFKFKVPGTYTAHTSYEVYYPGQGGSNDQAKISASQSQAEPNTTAHFGAAGDCGMATATKVTGKQQFAFTLDHKAAYLLFLPRTANTILHDCYLTKVEVNSDNDIADTYTLDPVTGKLTGTGTGKQIVLTTKDPTWGSSNYKGFPLTNSTASAATNGAYVVIKPGTHTLKIRYWVKDFATGIEGTITKTLTQATYDQNKYYNITANLNVRDYDGDHYYMWDAQEQYWKGHEWWSANKDQPVLLYDTNGNYPQSTTDPRFLNLAYTNGIDNPATHTSCKDLPNANEMSWYCMFGDPRWDADELWTTMGRLYKGGMWFKKKSVLQAENHYDSEKSADSSTDLRTTGKQYDNNSSSITNSGLPSTADAGNYFYLPDLGYYNYGQLQSIGRHGNYWSSSAYPSDNGRAYYLYFGPDRVGVYFNSRDEGFRAQKFSDFGDN